MDEVTAGALLDRREVVARLLRERGDLLVVSGLGSSSYDVMAVGDDERNYYLWAAMGSAAMVGLGLATAQPDRPVLVVTGDGEALMGFGALATISVRAPANLTIAILDNGHYGETGMQLSHAGLGIRLDLVAASLGYSWSAEIRDLAAIESLRDRIHHRRGVALACIKIKADEAPRALPPRDGAFIKNRFRASLGLRPI